MPEVAVQDGARLAERVRTRFAERRFEMPGQTIVHATVSIGVTQFQPGDDTKSFFCRADDGMYQAKRRGKDRVVIVEPPSGP